LKLWKTLSSLLKTGTVSLITLSSGFLCLFHWILTSFNALFRELLPLDQNEIKLRCLKEWGIPLKEESHPPPSSDVTWDAFTRKRKASNYFNKETEEVLRKKRRIDPPPRGDSSFTAPASISDRTYQQRNFKDIKERRVFFLL
jgi:hypothetical protein